jgi:hypothetical protein
VPDDPTVTGPDLYRVVFENDRVRSWSITTARATGPTPMPIPAA